MAAAVADLVNQAAAQVNIVTGAGQTVLISGVTGFLGTQVALEYAKRGFTVHATARSQSKADAWNQIHPLAAARTKWFIVQDIAVAGAFDEAIKGADIVAHTASPFHMNAKDPEKDMLDPAIQGTLSILKSATKTPGVKRIVITSSFAAVMDFANLGPSKTYNDTDWNSATKELAIAKGKDDPVYLYCASKKLAEEAAWNFVASEKPSWSLSVVCPCLILGPPQQVVENLDGLNTSSTDVWKILDPQEKELPATTLPVMVDVRDVATLHVLASTLDIARGQRYLAIAHHYSNDQIAYVLRQRMPDLAYRIPAAENKPWQEHFMTDCSKVEKELGIRWTSFDQTVVDTANKLLEIETRLRKAH